MIPSGVSQSHSQSLPAPWVMDCAPQSNLILWLFPENRQKSNLLVPPEGAGIDFVSPRAENKGALYLFSSEIDSLFYFSGSERGPFSQACAQPCQPQTGNLVLFPCAG